MKSILKIYYLLTYVLIIAISYSCEQPIESFYNPPPSEDPRKFSWTIMDTIRAPETFQIIMRNIWGSSASDIYICGWRPDKFDAIWHYDGISWQEVDLFQSLSSRPIILNCLHGFSSDNVWLGGDRIIRNKNAPPSFFHRKFIANWNGIKWTEHFLPGDFNSNIVNIDGDSPNNLWACGSWGQVHHWDGIAWTSESLSDLLIEGSRTIFYDVSSYNGVAYIVGREILSLEDRNLIKYFTLKGEIGNWEIMSIFDFKEKGSFGAHNLYLTPYNKLYSYLPGLFELRGNQWVRIIPEIQEGYDIRHMVAFSETNILFACDEGAFHWNGTDLQRIDIPGLNAITGIWYDGQEAFALGLRWNSIDQTVVWHGK